MANLKTWRDMDKQRMCFSGYVEDCDMAGLELDNLDLMLLADDEDQAADVLLKMELIFRRLHEQGGTCQYITHRADKDQEQSND